MKIIDLEIFNFRNYDHLQFKPHGNINLIMGKNAMGKTNLLEAIYILAYGKSFKVARDNEIIKLDCEKSNLKATMENFGYEDKYQVEINLNAKNNFYINEESLSSKEYKRDMASVIFTPADLDIIKFSPLDRRRYLDNLISKVDAIYDHNLSVYKKILFERNRLLKKSFNYDLLEVYNFQLSQMGVKLLRTRLNYIRQIEKYAKEHFKNLSGGDDLKITYLSTVPLKLEQSEMESIFLKHLKNSHKRDLELKYTTVGPHRDDLDFRIKNLSSKKFGSQGEIRSVVLSLKLAELDILREKLKTNPILLLDDVFSELDKSRSKYLVDSFKNNQIFITTTDLNEDILKDLIGKYFEINNGKINIL
ncbi:DNA replication/repair protein RecF [Anaerosphaera multitolerans]|uniref:DNA replication and repair protein RecF n=1 Tax=Anaerosphaera multitolerans TaxID=2487351 RepID=A0A437S9D8_9FIRM|nr:DNA replication/repair protein RecF [Anaerosphaera multitolerans]RVU55740.1 DNA replication/repair protein RecF [Anaerosphaera multitolerans]